MAGKGKSSGKKSTTRRSVLNVASGFKKGDRLVFLDLEGAEPNYVTEVGVVVCDLTGEHIESRRSLVDPGDVEWLESVIRLTGITPNMVKGQPNFREVWEGWLGELLEGSVVVCHDVQSDMARLNRDCYRYGIQMPTMRTFDTLEVARECVPESLKRSNKLGEACRALGIRLPKVHRADADADASRRLMREALRLHPLPFSRLEVKEFIPEERPRICATKTDGIRSSSVETALFSDVFGKEPAPMSVAVEGQTVLLKGEFASCREELEDLVQTGGGTIEESRYPTSSTTLVVVGDLGYTNRGALQSLELLKRAIERLNEWGASIRVVSESSLRLLQGRCAA